MCTGVEIAAIAAMAGGSVMQYQSAEAKADAQERAAKAEAMRQSQIDEKKQREFQAALQGFDRESQDQNIEQATTERKQLMSEAAGLPGDDATYQSPAASSAPRVVKDHADSQRGEADDFVALLGDARARLGAWGEGMFTPAQQMGELGFNLNELNTQAARSARTGQMDAQLSAANAGNELALAGNLLTSAGSAGLGGAFGGGGTSTLNAAQAPAASAGAGAQFAHNYYTSALTPTPLRAAGRLY